MTPRRSPLVEEEAELLADFAMEAYDIVKTARWRKYGYRSPKPFIAKYTSMSIMRFRQLAEVGKLTDTLAITRDDLARIGVDKIIRGLKGIAELLRNGHVDDARTWVLAMEHDTHDDVTRRSNMLSPVRTRLPYAIKPCPYCQNPIEVRLYKGDIRMTREDPPPPLHEV